MNPMPTEALVTRLVDDFAQGRMTRRQLIKTLTVAASAAAAGATAAGAATAAAADEKKGFQILTVNHISYGVADYKRTRDFYTDLFPNIKVMQDNGTTQCYLAFGDTFIIPRNARGERKPPLVDHIAYTIDNWNQKAVEEALKARGLTPRVDTENSFHVKDPDGYDLQISGKAMTASS
jgi:catechol 2,3-dioxygenase-like lactoylglutathione lyase family enzyme